MTAEIVLAASGSTDPNPTLTDSARQLMNAYGLDRKEMADILGVSLRTFASRLEAGGWKAAEVARLATAFRLQVADLYAGLEVRVERLQGHISD